jgi:hypothetical protein
MQGMHSRLETPDALLAASDVPKGLSNVHLHTRLDLKCDHDRSARLPRHCLDPS